MMNWEPRRMGLENVLEILRDESYTDLVFCFPDGRKLRGHCAVICPFSPLLMSLWKNEWNGPNRGTLWVSLETKYYDSLSVLLDLLYSGTSGILLNKESFTQIMEVADLTEITMRNVAFIYKNPLPSREINIIEGEEEIPYDDSLFLTEEEVNDEDSLPHYNHHHEPEIMCLTPGDNLTPIAVRENEEAEPFLSSSPLLPPPPYPFPIQESSPSRSMREPLGDVRCPHCQKGFPTWRRLKEHTVQHYSKELLSLGIDQGIYVKAHPMFCVHCSRQYTTHNRYLYHLAYIHNLLFSFFINDPILLTKFFPCVLGLKNKRNSEPPRKSL